MKQLPAETVIQILGHLSNPDLKSVALVASRYSILARPFLFQRIRLLFDTNVLPYWVSQIANSPAHAPMIKIIEIGGRWSKLCLEDVRNLVRFAVALEELLILAPLRTIPRELLDPAILPNLRKFAINANTNYDWLAIDFLPHCPKLINLELPHSSERLAWNEGFASTLQKHAPSFMNRLRRFRGPPYFLNYMSKSNRALQHFSASVELTDAEVSLIGKDIRFGQDLLSFHLVIARGPFSSDSDWLKRHCITPSIIPSLFPNLRSVAWFLVHHLLPKRQVDTVNESSCVEASEPLISPNAELLAVIEQLPHLRQVFLVSHHSSRDGSFPDVITAFVTVLQKESDTALPHLNTVSIWAVGSVPSSFWAVGSAPSSYTWRKRYIDSEDGKTRPGWICATNEIVNPDRELLSQHL